jgi:hypothetical protein
MAADDHPWEQESESPDSADVPRCIECGAQIAAALAALASVRCHDCRRPGPLTFVGSTV